MVKQAIFRWLFLGNSYRWVEFITCLFIICLFIINYLFNYLLIILHVPIYHISYKLTSFKKSLYVNYTFCTNLQPNDKISLFLSLTPCIMVLILDGNWLRGAHIRRNLYYSTCLSHLIRSRERSQIGYFLSEKTYFPSNVRNMIWANI